MKYKTSITKVEEVEVDINPVKVLQSLLDTLLHDVRIDRLNQLGIEGVCSFIVIKKDLEVYAVKYKAGYSHGHYESDPEHKYTNITNELDSATYAKLVSFKTTLKYLEEENK